MSPVKFTFDTDFNEARKPKPKVVDLAPAAPTFSEAELAAAREAAFAEGVAAGRAQAQGETDAQLGRAEQRLVSLVEDIVEKVRADQARLPADAAHLGLAVGRALASALMQRHPFAEIEKVVADCFSELREEPRVVIQVSTAILGPLRERVEALARRAAFPGELIFLGDDRMSPDDIRVEWAHGGALRDHEHLTAVVERAVERFVAAKDAPLFNER